MKLADGIHARQVTGFAVWESEAEISNVGGSGSLEVGSGVAGGGHHQLRPKIGKLISDVGFADMVRYQGIHAPKRRASCPLCGTGFRGGIKGNGVNPARRPQRKVAVTARRKGGRS